MNREDELFDDFLRSKFESKEFTNKPHYWQNAQEMIAQGRKNNTSFRPIIVGSVVLVAALSFGLLFNSKSSVNQSNANTLTASSVSVGTSTTATYTINSIPASTVNTGVAEQSAQNTEADNNGNTPNEGYSTADTYTKNGGANASSPSNNNGPRHPKHQKRNRNNSTVDTEHSVQQHTTPDVIDINGKTLIAPFNTSTEAPEFNKTTAYVEHAANRQRSFIAVEAGINAYNPASDIMNSINGQIGVRYYRFINSKIALSTGLTYARLHQNLPGRSYESTNYDFGKNAASVVITTQRLDYIELPVSILYQLAPKHALTAGVSLGYVIQSADKLQDETGDQSQQNGYLNGINRWDTQLNLGYQFNLSQNIWIRTSYHMGLMDISDNTIFKQAGTDTNKGLRLTLGYKVF
jgi:hypothetical protein